MRFHSRLEAECDEELKLPFKPEGPKQRPGLNFIASHTLPIGLLHISLLPSPYTVLKLFIPLY